MPVEFGFGDRAMVADVAEDLTAARVPEADPPFGIGRHWACVGGLDAQSAGHVEIAVHRRRGVMSPPPKA